MVSEVSILLVSSRLGADLVVRSKTFELEGAAAEAEAEAEAVVLDGDETSS